MEIKYNSPVDCNLMEEEEMQDLVNNPRFKEAAKNIKKCPFCGGTGMLENAVSWKDASEKEVVEWHFVNCTQCSCMGPVQLSVEDAVYAWNKRVKNA